jgi:hypothetical protein
MCYTVNRLKLNGNGNGNGNIDEHEFTVDTQLEYETNTTTFTVKLKWVNDFILDFKSATEMEQDLTTVQFADVVFRQGRLCPMIK